MLPRFCENEVKKIAFPACCTEENATFSTHIHRTWEHNLKFGLNSQDFLDGSSRLWMGLGVKDEDETPAAAGEVTKEAVKNDNDLSDDMGEYK